MEARALHVLLAPVLLAAQTFASDVWLVGTGGVATIDEAIALAADGDVVLVGGGTYPGFTLAAKSLVIVADEGARVVIDGTVIVHSLAFGQTATLQGLEIQVQGLETGLCTIANEGAVWIEECEVRTSTSYGARPGLEAVACASVVVRRSSIVGGHGGWEYGDPGGPAVSVRESTAGFFSCTLTGGEGGWSGAFWGSCETDGGKVGGPGVLTENATVLLQDVAAQGGRGGSGDYCSLGSPAMCGDGGPGGAGLVCTGAGETTLVGVTLLGGAGGYAGDFPCSEGPVGAPLVDLGTTPPVVIDATPVELVADSPLREGALAVVVGSSAPGDLVAVYASFEPAMLELSSLLGVLLLAPPQVFLGASVLPASGAFQLQESVPDLGASVDALSLRLQAVVLTASGAVVLGEPATLVLLDAAF